MTAQAPDTVSAGPLDSGLTMALAISNRMPHFMQKDNRVILLGEDVSGGVFGTSTGLIDEFGASRIIDTPISEAAFVGMGVGAAMTGLRPVVEVMFADFLTVCADPLINQAAKIRFLSGEKQSLPLVIRVSEGASGGGAAVHSQSLHGLFAHVAGLTIACATDGVTAADLLEQGIKSPDPMILFEPRALYDRSDCFSEIPARIGQARQLRGGQDITLVGIGSMLGHTLEAADKLSDLGIDASVIDPVTLSPLDLETITASVEQTGRLVVIDESLGFASHLCGLISDRCWSSLHASPKALTPPFSPVPYAADLEKAWRISVEDIVDAAKTSMQVT